MLANHSLRGLQPAVRRAQGQVPGVSQCIRNRSMRLKTRSVNLLALALTVLTATTVILPFAARAQGSSTPLAAQPLPPEVSPTGDIPDTQVFIDYNAPLGFSVKVPEGWSRRVAGDGVTFTSAYDALAVQLSQAAAPPSLASVKQNQAAALEKSPAAVRITKIAAIDLPAGPAFLISFGSNSEPNGVTGKAIRLENDQYLFWKGGRLATLTLSAPFGTDNVDQWRMMARSFQWR